MPIFSLFGGLASVIRVCCGEYPNSARSLVEYSPRREPFNLEALEQRLLLSGDVSFQAVRQFPVGAYPVSVAVADFNGDGTGDLAVANLYDNTVSILLGNGNGTFKAKVDYPTGLSPMSVVVGDFNGDGKIDLAVANIDSNTVSILIGTGDGTFQDKADFTAGGEPYFLSVCDFDQDNKTDLVVMDRSNHCGILDGEGDGTFHVWDTFSAGPGDVVVADFDGDGKSDLAVPGTWGDTVQVFLNASGYYGNVVSYAVGQSPWAVNAGDFNGDGKSDLVVANSGHNTLSILLGNGDGTFQPQTKYGVGSHSSSIVVGDFNGDGNSDLAVANSDKTVSVVLGKGDGTFPSSSSVSYSVCDNPGSIVTGDFNRDGKNDLAVVGRSSNAVGITGFVAILLNQGDGTFQNKIDTLVGSDATDLPEDALVADFNQDGKIDLAVFIPGGMANMLLGKGDGGFQGKVNLGVGGSATAIGVGDFNGDHRLDFVAFGGSFGSIALGNGDGTFQQSGNYYIYLGQYITTTSIVVADFNKDGKDDFAVAYWNKIGIFLGNGDGTFQAKVDYTVALWPEDLSFGDFNQDGNVDLAIASGLPDGKPGEISIMLNQGDGTFFAPVNYPMSFAVTSVTVGDFNGDGKADLAAVAAKVQNIESPGAASIFLGQGDGTLQFKADYAVGVNPISIIASDLNGDGMSDLAVANKKSNTISVLLGNGDGTFPVRADYAVNSGPSSINVADFDGEGQNDLVVVHSGDRRVSVLLNNTEAATLQKAISSTVVYSEGNSVAYGQSTTFTAKVTSIVGGIPTGTVQFMVDGNPVGNAVAINISGEAAYTSSPLIPGSHGIVAVYSGDTVFNGSTSEAIIKVVGQLEITNDLVGTGTNGGQETLSLGEAMLGQNGIERMFFLTNHGSQPLSLSGWKLAGFDSKQFVVTVRNDMGKIMTGTRFIIGAGKTWTVTVQAKPKGVPGTREAAITFASGDPAKPSVTLTMTVQAQMPAPQVATSKGVALWTEKASPAADARVKVDAGLSIKAYPSMSLLLGATVQIADGYVAGQDVLSFVNTAKITGIFDSTTGILTLTGTDTVANYQKALRAVMFTNTSRNPNLANKTFTFTVVASQTLQGTANRIMSIKPYNDAPTLSQVNVAMGVGLGQERIITFAEFKTASNLFDIDTPESAWTFKINSVVQGYLTILKANTGTPVKITSSTVFGPGDVLYWMAPNRWGKTMVAFTVKGYDGAAKSALFVPVLI